jgi:HK97 family phage prohead protease
VRDDRRSPFSAARKDLSSASSRCHRDPDDPLVRSLLVPVSLACPRDLSLGWNGNPALGRLRLRVVSRPQNHALPAMISQFSVSCWRATVDNTRPAQVCRKLTFSLSVRDELERSVLSRMVAHVPDGYILSQPGVFYPERANTCIPVVRRSAVNAKVVDKSRRISMLAVPYGVESVDLGGFKEIYSPGCFNGGLDNDPVVLLNHDDRLILGRQSSNARFYDAGIGLRCDVDLPDVSYANDLLVLMRQGIITNSSAAFWILRFHWETRDGERFRIVDRALMRECSPVSFPAYKTTTASVQAGDGD